MRSCAARSWSAKSRVLVPNGIVEASWVLISARAASSPAELSLHNYCSDCRRNDCAAVHLRQTSGGYAPRLEKRTYQNFLVHHISDVCEHEQVAPFLMQGPLQLAQHLNDRQKRAMSARCTGVSCSASATLRQNCGPSSLGTMGTLAPTAVAPNRSLSAVLVRAALRQPDCMSRPVSAHHCVMDAWVHGRLSASAFSKKSNYDTE